MLQNAEFTIIQKLVHAWEPIIHKNQYKPGIPMNGGQIERLNLTHKFIIYVPDLFPRGQSVDTASVKTSSPTLWVQKAGALGTTVKSRVERGQQFSFGHLPLPVNRGAVGIDSWKSGQGRISGVGMELRSKVNGITKTRLQGLERSEVKAASVRI